MDNKINKVTEVKVNGKVRKKVRTVFDKDNPRSVSRTQQHFKKDTNINSIMKKYKKSGLLVDPSIKPTAMPQFGDFTKVEDFHSLQNRLCEIQSYFNSLPVEIRTKFKNDPHQLMAFMNDEANHEEALRLGLIDNDLDNIKYTDREGNDITEAVIAKRGLFRNGKLVKGGPGSPEEKAYLQKIGQIPPEPVDDQNKPEQGEGGNS